MAVPTTRSSWYSLECFDCPATDRLATNSMARVARSNTLTVLMNISIDVG